jgi:ribose transport system ATP-binding protein
MIVIVAASACGGRHAFIEAVSMGPLGVHDRMARQIAEQNRERPFAADRGVPSVTLRLRDVAKRFSGVLALKGVSFESLSGEVHALVGENGAGKSTLMGVAAGDLVPDSGTVEIDGARVEVFSSAQSAALGLTLVHQHPALLPELTVAENLILAMPPSIRAQIRDRDAWVGGRLSQWNAEFLPGARVATLSMSDQHLVELIKATSLNPRVLILDEPTEHMDREGIDRLFQGIRATTAAGCTVIYISHRIHEVKAIADRVTVLRDGETRGTFDVADLDVRQIVNLVVGRTLAAAFPPKAAVIDAAAAPVLAVGPLSGPGFSDVTLEARRGEIIGLAGIEGNGQRDFLRALAGLVPSLGPVLINGEGRDISDPAASRRAGLVYVPRERHREGLMLQLGVGKNIGLIALARNAFFGIIDRRRELLAIREQVTALSIKTPRLDSQVQTLSGGNQQKAVIARCLMDQPSVLLADEPSQGVDAGARFEIYTILRAAADSGRGVIIASADAMELEGICDRVLIFSRGSVVSELSGANVVERRITEAALTATTLRTPGKSTRRTTPLRSFLEGDYAPSVVLLAAILALGAFASFISPYYLTGRNFSNMLTLLTAVTFISLGQLVILLAGAIDLSVGPLTGLVVVAASFFINDDVSQFSIVAGFVVSLLVAAAVGATNWFLARQARITPVIATLTTYMALQGVSLLLRPIPGGLFNSDITAAINSQIGFVPVAFILCVLVVALLEYGLRRTRWGLALRAVGSNEANARRVGVNVGLTYFGAYLLCSLLTYLGGVMLMAQIGVGDPTAGVTYTLASVTAVVLGGASLFGGRGSFIGALLGATLVQQIINVTTFVRLSPAWQYWLLGALTLAAAIFYSQLGSLGGRRT